MGNPSKTQEWMVERLKFMLAEVQEDGQNPREVIQWMFRYDVDVLPELAVKMDRGELLDEEEREELAWSLLIQVPLLWGLEENPEVRRNLMCPLEGLATVLERCLSI